MTRLRSLELHGYKTFATRTGFEFSGAVTAIVGPNGSGKSNIADAIRWVLGEQSYSLLRGKRTEDMIFSGSEYRPRSGMASATVVLDNSDSWLPIDFTEVAITRRAYRDGENEYLLNGQRVRLRDVYELLAQSGLAERTYTIIGQGLVDAALALKAEERRRLFEEAAGIGLYRSRHEEALHRLENTRRNLERVQDILTELEPRLVSLERQARRAQEFHQLKNNLHEVLRDWYGFHWHRAQKELVETRELVRQQDSAWQTKRQEHVDLDHQFQSVQARLQAIRSQLTSLQRQSVELQSNRESILRKLAVSQERIKSIQEQLSNARSTSEKFQEEIVLQNQLLEADSQDVQRLQAELEMVTSQATKAQQEYQSKLAIRQAAEAANQITNTKLLVYMTRQSQLMTRFTERELEIERKQTLLESLVQALQNTEQEYSSVCEKTSMSASALEDAKNECVTAESELNAHQRKLAEKEKDLIVARDQYSTSKEELSHGQAQIGVLEQAEQQLIGYARGARLLLQAAREAKVNGVLGAISSCLEVPADLETAITTVLGEFSDGIVLDKGANPEKALELLANETARISLLPLGSLVTAPKLSPQKLPGVIGVAAQLVSTTEKFQPVIDLLLGQVIVVQDRKTAIKVVNSLKDKSEIGVFAPRVVTLNGEVFHVSGLIMRGLDNKPIPFTRTREKSKLAKKISTLTQQVTDNEEHLRTVEDEWKKLKTGEQSLLKNLHASQKREQELMLAFRHNQLREEQLKAQLQWQSTQHLQLLEEIKQDQKALSQTNRELEIINPELVGIREEIQKQVTALNEIGIEEAQSQVSRLLVSVALTKRAVEEAQSRQSERQQLINNQNEEQQALSLRIADFENVYRMLEKEIQALQQSDLEINKQVITLSSLVEAAEGDLVRTEQELSIIQNAEREARLVLSAGENKANQAKINLSRRQETLDVLRKKIEDDFGLVAFEYREDVSGPTPLPLSGFVEELPLVNQLLPDTEETLKRYQGQLRRLGTVNLEAESEYQEVLKRFKFLKEQMEDLRRAEADIHKVIAELDTLMKNEFQKTFNAVAGEFHQIFTRLFGGGSARLVLTNPDDLSISGIDIEARLPGRREQGLSLLSGGERSLTAVALVFSLLRVSPTPFCVLDEVDAMLDEANINRFRDLLLELSQTTQFVIITHNRNTVQVADVLYGVTMGRDSTSQVISLRLDEVDKVAVE